MSERMTLLHTGDLHFTYTNYGKIDPFGKHTRFLEVSVVWHHMIDIAIANRVDAVLVAGDLFRNTKPEAADLLLLGAGLRRLGEAGITSVVIEGNHDRKTSEPAGLDLIAAMRIPGVYCTGSPEITRVPTRAHGVLQVGCFPAFTRANFMAHDEYKGLSPSELAHTMAARAGDVVRSLAARVEPEEPAVLLAHHAVSGATLGSEQTLRLGGTGLVLALDDFCLPQWQAVLLGDIHRAQVLQPAECDAPWIGYCGSPYRIDFGEEAEQKGCYVHTLEKPSWGPWRHTEAEFIGTPCRQFHTIDADLSRWTPGEDLPRWVESLKDSVAARGAIARVKLTVSEEHARLIDRDLIARNLYAAGAHHVAGIAVEVVREVRTRDREVTEALTPVTALPRWLALRPDLEGLRAEIEVAAAELTAVKEVVRS